MRTYTYRSALLGSSAAIALSLGMGAAPALAFDTVNWTWNKTIEETVIKNVLIDSTIFPTGMTEVEKLQIHIGDVTATSSVYDIYNNPPAGGGGGGTVIIDELFDFSTTVDDSTDPSTVVAPVGGVDDGDSLVTATLLGGTEDEGSDDLSFQIQVQGEIPFEVIDGDALDAETELPSVESAATAVGNNQSIKSAVSTQLHDAQILFDVADEGSEPNPALLLVGNATDNLHTNIALSTALAAALGVIDKSNITATSTVYNIWNASVDSDATAVGNNMSIDLSTAQFGDQLLIADLTQVAVADISASSSVSNVSVNNYANLAAVNPLVSSVATAVGNNVSINVGVPTP